MAAVEKLDRSLEEAARAMGARPWAIHRDVILPALAPAIVASGALVFATALGAFGTAFTPATNIDVLQMLIYTEFTLSANIAMAAALSVGLGLVAWAILALARSFSGNTIAAAGGPFARGSSFAVSSPSPSRSQHSSLFRRCCRCSPALPRITFAASSPDLRCNG